MDGIYHRSHSGNLGRPTEKLLVNHDHISESYCTTNRRYIHLQQNRSIASPCGNQDKAAALVFPLNLVESRPRTQAGQRQQINQIVRILRIRGLACFPCFFLERMMSFLSLMG
jgi:hypothetical protein